jgi:hypothetical protein
MYFGPVVNSETIELFSELTLCLYGKRHVYEIVTIMVRLAVNFSVLLIN